MRILVACFTAGLIVAVMVGLAMGLVAGLATEVVIADLGPSVPVYFTPVKVENNEPLVLVG